MIDPYTKLPVRKLFFERVLDVSFTLESDYWGYHPIFSKTINKIGEKHQIYALNSYGKLHTYLEGEDRNNYAGLQETKCDVTPLVNPSKTYLYCSVTEYRNHSFSVIYRFPLKSNGEPIFDMTKFGIDSNYFRVYLANTTQYPGIKDFVVLGSVDDSTSDEIVIQEINDQTGAWYFKVVTGEHLKSRNRTADVLKSGYVDSTST